MNKSIEVHEGDNVTIYYLPTVPYFCSKSITKRKNCINNVEIVIPKYQNDRQCENGRAKLELKPETSCGFIIKGIMYTEDWKKRWNELKATPLKLNVTASLSPQYDEDLSMSIKAKVASIIHHKVWTNTTIPEVQVM